MHDELKNLRQMLCKELKEFGNKGELSAGSLDTIDKLSHAIKNLDKVIEMSESEEYSSNRNGSYRGSYNGSYDGDGSMRGSYEGSMASNGSYARGRGRNARRDSMGRYASDAGYSRADDMEQMVESIRSMMQDLPQDMQKDAQRFVEKLEQQTMM